MSVYFLKYFVKYSTCMCVCIYVQMLYEHVETFISQDDSLSQKCVQKAKKRKEIII